MDNDERIKKIIRNRNMKKNRLNVFFDYLLNLLIKIIKIILKIIFHILKRMGYDGIFIISVILIGYFLLTKKLLNNDLPKIEISNNTIKSLVIITVGYIFLVKYPGKSKEKSKKKSKENDDSGL